MGVGGEEGSKGRKVLLSRRVFSSSGRSRRSPPAGRGREGRAVSHLLPAQPRLRAAGGTGGCEAFPSRSPTAEELRQRCTQIIKFFLPHTRLSSPPLPLFFFFSFSALGSDLFCIINV